VFVNTFPQLSPCSSKGHRFALFLEDRLASHRDTLDGRTKSKAVVSRDIGKLSDAGARAVLPDGHCSQVSSAPNSIELQKVM
jgi:hypothetical protein